MLSKEFIIGLKQYVDSHLAISTLETNECVSYKSMAEPCFTEESLNLTEFVKKNKKDTFTELLFKYIDKSGTTDSEVYKKAGLDRRLFSKIRSNNQYRPSKSTAVALALALKLSEKETSKLIGAAGYILSDSDTADLVIKYCIGQKMYDLHKVNAALDYFSLKPLAGAIE